MSWNSRWRFIAKRRGFRLTKRTVFRPLRRAAASVASNIAEGKGRASDKELMQFLNRARSSLFEIETQLQIAGSLGYLAAPGEILQHSEEIGKMLNGMISRLGKRSKKPRLRPES